MALNPTTLHAYVVDRQHALLAEACRNRHAIEGGTAMTRTFGTRTARHKALLLAALLGATLAAGSEAVAARVGEIAANARSAGGLDPFQTVADRSDEAARVRRV